MKTSKTLTLSLFIFFFLLPLGHVHATGSPGQNRANAQDSSTEVAQRVRVSFGYGSYYDRRGDRYNRRYHQPYARGYYYYGYPQQRYYYYSPYYRPYYYQEYDRPQDGRSYNYYYRY